MNHLQNNRSVAQDAVIEAIDMVPIGSYLPADGAMEALGKSAMREWQLSFSCVYRRVL